MKKRAFIFPGQGAQYVGMAKDLYDADADCKAVIDSAADAVDFDLRAIMFEPNELINKTEYTQAAMLAAEVCVLEAVKKTGAECAITGGLSLGEYAALVACGAMEFTDAMRVVRKRGMYMESTVPAGKGGMSAIIGLGADVVEGACREASQETGLCVVPANYNCPGQIVASGDKAAVDAAGELCKAAGAKLVAPLNVSGPFHSPLLVPAGEKLAETLSGVKFGAPKIPYVCNVSAEKVTDPSLISDLLVRQVYSPVRWEQSVRVMLDDGVEEFVEIGPGKTLAGFMKRIDRAIPVVTVGGAGDLEKLA